MREENPARETAILPSREGPKRGSPTILERPAILARWKLVRIDLGLGPKKLGRTTDAKRRVPLAWSFGNDLPVRD
jgi:hypothetical protein